MTNLPQDVFEFYIFPKLLVFNNYSDLRSCTLVCRKWFLLVSPLLWKQVLLKSKDSISNFHYSLSEGRTLLNYSTFIQSLIILFPTDIVSDSIYSHRFFLPYYHEVLTKDTFFDNIKRCFNLNSIIIPSLYISKSQLEKLLHLESIKTLMIDNILSPMDWTKIDNSVIADDDKTYKTLTCLRKFSHLQVLHIGSRYLTSKILIEIVKEMVDITRIEILQCQEDSIYDFGISQGISNCKSLSHFGIPFSNFHSPTLNHWKFLRDDSIMILTQSCPNLNSIKIPCSSITDSSLVHIAKNCLNIEHVDLSYSAGISTRGINRFLKKSPLLKRVIVIGCPGIEGGKVNSIVSGNGTWTKVYHPQY
jgi:hypothetical protein